MSRWIAGLAAGPGWRCLLGVVLLGCHSSASLSDAGADGCIAPGYTALGSLSLPPVREDDLVFVINNSPSMAPKRERLLQQLPRLLNDLKDPVDGSLPNLRVAILDGDLGSGGAITTGACGPKNGSLLGDAGQLQAIGGLDCGMTDPSARWLKTVTLTPANYSGDIAQVFACLASGLGQAGCGYQQPLQALALAAADRGPAGLSAFLRPEAYLDIVIISDEDDCSAGSSPGMFAPAIPGEADGLRCATRGHACGGASLAYPTVDSYAHLSNDCSARTDLCPVSTDTSQATACSPLADVHALAEQIKALKQNPDETIMVAGIFGWPRRNVDAATVEYKIAPMPNPGYVPGSTTPATIYDVWPVCYDADHPPQNPDPATGFDPAAALYGAKPGLRLSAFVDEFGWNGSKLSMCEPDWTPAMAVFESTLGHKIAFPCVDQRLVDADPSTPEIDPDCIVEYIVPTVEKASTPPSCAYCPSQACGSDGGSSEWSRTVFPRCDPNAPEPPCWQLVNDSRKCPLNGQLLDMHRVPVPYTPGGARFRIQCRVCPATDAGPSTIAGCESS